MSGYNSISSIRARIRELNDLREYVIEEVEWADFLTSVVVRLQRPAEESPDGRAIELRFRDVQQINAYMNLRQSNLEEPASRSWGLNEIALVRVDNESPLLEVADHLDQQFFHATFLWEDDRRIDIVFRVLEIAEKEWARP